MGLIAEHRDFRRLWIGETVSQLGSQVSMLAVPLAAVVALHAGTFQVGLLTAMQYLAFLLVGLPAGAWIDRMRRRPVLMASNVGRAALLAWVPVAAALHLLGLAQLYLVVFGLGLGTVLFDVAYLAYLPVLVGRERLVEGNARLEASRSAAYAIGPGLAGLLVQALSAPIALLVDAASMLWSTGWVAAIRRPEPHPGRPEPHPARRTPARRRAMAAEIGDGLRLVTRDPILRVLALYGTVSVLFLSGERALEVVFLVRTVHLAPGGVGALFSVASLGSVLGALVAGPLSSRVGTVPTILGVTLVGNAAMLLVPLTVPGAGLALFAVGAGICSCGIVIYNVVAGSYRQTRCPDGLLGRMNATMRFVMWGAAPLGATLGGVLGSTLGPRTALWAATGGGLAAALCLLRLPGRAAHVSTVELSSPVRQ